MAGPGNPIAERRVVDHLRNYRAVRPDKAMGYAPMRWTHARALQRLREAGVVKSADGALWLDEAAWEDHRARRRKRAMIVLAVGAIGASLAALTTLRG